MKRAARVAAPFSRAIEELLRILWLKHAFLGTLLAIRPLLVVVSLVVEGLGQAV